MSSIPTPLISPPQLQDYLQASPQGSQSSTPKLDPGVQDLVIFDCRFNLAEPHQGRSQYEAGHIPGAYYVDLNEDLADPVQARGGRHPLPNLDRLSAQLSAWGVQRGHTWVVAYDDSRFAFASRLWWLLRYLGHDRVAVLDGGYGAWQTLGYGVTPEVPALPPAAPAPRFVPQVQSPWVVDGETVQSYRDHPAIVVVDSREPGRYRGEFEPIDPIAGHIPGAINQCWLEVTEATGEAKPISWHGDHWASVRSAQEVVVYCGSGVTACVNLLSLELAGLGTGKLYAGSWSDWCALGGEVAVGADP